MGTEATYVYIIAANYHDYQQIMVTEKVCSDESPFTVILNHCQQTINAPRGEAASYLETGHYDIVLWRVDGGVPELVAVDDIGFPWREISAIKEQVSKLKQALKTVTNLAALNDIPGAPQLFQGLDVDATTTFLRELERKHDKLHDAWEDMKTTKPARPLRSVQVDPPPEDDVPF